jgi:rhodanese-related sulfurtransferase
MTGREFKDLIFEEFAKIAAALASPKRLEIIDVLAQGPRDVETLAKQTAMTVANTSRHLQILKAGRLVDIRRDGVRIVYRLADAEVLKGWLALRSLAEKRTAEISAVARSFFEARDSLEPITMKELRKRLHAHQVVVLDVRPAEEYQSGHIPGAISIPLTELKNRLAEIPRRREVVAYCRGPYCVLSVDAMAMLRKAGYRAVRLKDGFPEWKEAGLPVE